MAKRKCPKCNTSNRGDATYCRHCGEKLSSLNQQSASNTSKDEEGCLSTLFTGVAIIVSWILIGGGIVCVFSGMAEGLWLSGIGIIILVILNILGKT